MGCEPAKKNVLPWFHKGRRALLAPAIGNILEFYDFALYGVMTPLLSPIFFAKADTDLTAFFSFSVLFIGFLARPLGAILFGHFGDRFGRKRGLCGSLMMMALATTLIGVLPTYQQIGVIAPALLVFARFLQGLSAGGEGYGGVIFSLEHSTTSETHGRLSALMSAAAIMGLILATVMSALVGFMIDSAPNIWRLPFCLGGLIGLWGLFLRRSLKETPMFSEIANKNMTPKHPLRETISGAWRSVLVAFGISCFAGGLQLTLAGYVTIYLVTYKQMPFSSMSLLNSVCLTLYIPLLIFMGTLADRWSHVRMMRVAAVLTCLLALPIYGLLQSKNIIVVAMAQIGLTLLSALCIAPKSAVLFRLFPTELRYTGMSLGYTMGVSFFGGAMPLINHSLILKTGNAMAPAWILMIAACAGFLTLAFVDPERNSAKK